MDPSPRNLPQVNAWIPAWGIAQWFEGLVSSKNQLSLEKKEWLTNYNQYYIEARKEYNDKLSNLEKRENYDSIKEIFYHLASEDVKEHRKILDIIRNDIRCVGKEDRVLLC